MTRTVLTRLPDLDAPALADLPVADALPEALGAAVAHHHVEPQPARAVAPDPVLETLVQDPGRPGAMERGGDDEEPDVPDPGGQQVRHHARRPDRVARAVDEADEPGPVVGPAGGRAVLELLPRGVLSRALAADDEEILGVRLEEALEPGNVVLAHFHGAERRAREECRIQDCVLRVNPRAGRTPS